MKIAAAIRYLSQNDDLSVITDLVHAAYASRAKADLKYWATHQSIQDTAKRFSIGQGFIAELDGRIVGTLTIRPPQADSVVPLYRDPTVWTLVQFGVLPELQGCSIGRQLHDAALEYAKNYGGKVIALDTAAPATELIEMYRKWGYSVVGECDWRPKTNYLSIIMSRLILSNAL